MISLFNANSISFPKCLYECLYLKDFTFPTCIDSIGITKTNSMFHECSNLEKLNLRCIRTNKVKSMDHMFYQYRLISILDLSNSKHTTLKR